MSPPFRLAEWRVEPQLNRIRRGDEVRPLEPRAMDVLVVLADRPRETVARQAILDAVWGDTVVIDGVLSRAVHALRTALGDAARDPRYIQTIQRRGYRLIAPVAREEATDTAEAAPADTPAAVAGPSGRRQGRRWLVAVMALAGLLLLAAFLVRGARPEAPTAMPTRVAVMAFEDLTGDGSGTALARGATETIAAMLAGVERLRVFAPTPASVALPPVEAWLQGSIATSGDGIRLSARLTRVDGELLWGQLYEDDGSAILRLQSELAHDAAAALGQAVTVPASWRREVDARAYRLYLSGRQHLADRNTDAFRRAERAFEQAIAYDPALAAAHAGLAESYLLLGDYLGLPRLEARERAATHADRALEIDADSPEALVARAHVAMDGTWSFDEAAALMRRAVELAPGHAEGLISLAEILAYQGSRDDALKAADRARRTDPGSILIAARCAKVLLQAGRFADAETELGEVIDHAPPFGWAVRYRAYALERLGRHDAALDVWRQHIALDLGFDREARARAEAMMASEGTAGHWRWRLGTLEERLARGGHPHPAAVAEAHAGAGDAEAAFIWLATALVERDDWLLDLLQSPAFDALRGPRLVALLAPHGIAHLATVAAPVEADRR